MRSRAVALAGILLVLLSACAVPVPQPHERRTLTSLLEQLPAVDSVRTQRTAGTLDVPGTTTLTVDLGQGTDEADLQEAVLLWRAWVVDNNDLRVELVIRDLPAPPATAGEASELHLADPTLKVEAITAQWAALRSIGRVNARSDLDYDNMPQYALDVILFADTEHAMHAALDLVPIAGEITVTLTTNRGEPIATLDASACTATGPFSEELWRYWGGPQLCG